MKFRVIRIQKKLSRCKKLHVHLTYANLAKSPSPNPLPEGEGFRVFTLALWERVSRSEG
jgi:hypothetical protein